MIKFLLIGLLRDKGRSLVPVLVVATGVMLCVFMHAYVSGIMGETIEMNAKFTTGHVKIMTKAYSDNIDQVPNDLALMDVSALMGDLKNEYQQMEWVPRIKFGGLIDAPDQNGETKAQGPAMGLGLDLLSGNSSEKERLKIQESLVRGAMPEKQGEILLSEEFSQKLKVNPGNEITLIGSTMNGSMTMYNFIVAGTIRFGSSVLDRGTVIADLEDARLALDMVDAAGEIVGYFKTGYYNQDKAAGVVQKFNSENYDPENEYSPFMLSLKDQDNMSLFVDMSEYMVWLVTFIFIIAMSLVLWNAGLLGGLRRYGEMGVRLAIGEEKKHVYFTMIAESVMIGIMGSILGTVLGLFFAFLIQHYGIDISSMMEGASILMPSKIRAHITPVDFYIGFVPGIISTVIGTALSGIGIFKRKTAQLFKELET
ncbi:MAG: FtsX-like permease family protein [Prolixibacteraceae bacterium]|nr:FtsX-like permease family protein [Prolixibacteraceae bacterium]